MLSDICRTPGKALEARLNKDYGPGNPYYEDFCKYVRLGIEEGWAASGELDGPKYRRGKVGLLLCLYITIADMFRLHCQALTICTCR